MCFFARRNRGVGDLSWLTRVSYVHNRLRLPGRNLNFLGGGGIWVGLEQGKGGLGRKGTLRRVELGIGIVWNSF